MHNYMALFVLASLTAARVVVDRETTKSRLQPRVQIPCAAAAGNHPCGNPFPTPASEPTVQTPVAGAQEPDDAKPWSANSLFESLNNYEQTTTPTLIPGTTDAYYRGNRPPVIDAVDWQSVIWPNGVPDIPLSCPRPASNDPPDDKPPEDEPTDDHPTDSTPPGEGAAAAAAGGAGAAGTVVDAAAAVALTAAALGATAAGLTQITPPAGTDPSASCSTQGGTPNPYYALNDDSTDHAWPGDKHVLPIYNAPGLVFDTNLGRSIVRADFVAVIDTLQALVDCGYKPSEHDQGVLTFTNGTVTLQYGVNINDGKGAQGDAAFPGVVALYQWLRCDGGSNIVTGTVRPQDDKYGDIARANIFSGSYKGG